MAKFSLILVILAASSVPTFAVTYYVAVNNKTSRCTVTETKPSGDTVTQVSDQTYATRKEAVTAMKAACQK